MDRIISTIIILSVTIALAMILSTYYTGFVHLFMNYEEDIVRELEKRHGKGEAYYTLDEGSLHDNQLTLRKFGEILTILADCIDKVKQTERLPPFFEFYIPR